MDGDTDIDLAVANYGDNTVSVISIPFDFFIVKGDINGDGYFTPADVVLELRCVFLGSCPLPVAAYDMNCDGNLTPADVVILLNLVFNGTPPPC